MSELLLIVGAIAVAYYTHINSQLMKIHTALIKENGAILENYHAEYLCRLDRLEQEVEEVKRALSNK